MLVPKIPHTTTYSTTVGYSAKRSGIRNLDTMPSYKPLKNSSSTCSPESLSSQRSCPHSVSNPHAVPIPTFPPPFQRSSHSKSHLLKQQKTKQKKCICATLANASNLLCDLQASELVKQRKGLGRDLHDISSQL